VCQCFHVISVVKASIPFRSRLRLSLSNVVGKSGTADDAMMTRADRATATTPGRVVRA
jgi:hypothetical protein